MPDERWGEAPHAFVVLKAGAMATETELRNYARDHLAHFKCPKRVQFLSAPQNSYRENSKIYSSRKAAGHFQTVITPTAGALQRCNDVTLLTI